MQDIETCVISRSSPIPHLCLRPSWTRLYAKLNQGKQQERWPVRSFGYPCTRGSPTKFGMEHPLVSVGYLEIAQKYNFGKTPNLPHMALDRGQNPFAHFFFGGGNLDTFLNGPSGARPVNGLASQRVRSSPQPASLYMNV